MSNRHTSPIELPGTFAMARFAEPRRALTACQTGNAHFAWSGSSLLAGLLLAASMAALMVVADQLIETWTDGHLLAGWVALWTVVFAGLALLASPLRQMAAFLAGGFLRQVSAIRCAQTEARMWEMARHDPRVRDEIRAATLRHVE